MDHSTRKTRLTIQDADRKMDSGTYSVEIFCNSNKKRQSGYVHILDSPEQPRYIEAEKGAKNGDNYVRLKWTCPYDDGGSPVTSYVIRSVGDNKNESDTKVTYIF